MQWGIEFSILYTDSPLLVNFPEPTHRVRYTNGKGLSQNLTVKYLFRYKPQGWREMQRVSSIKSQMQQLIPSIIFEEDVVTNIDADIDKIYTVNELGKYFPRFIKYPQPWYPQDKDEYMSRLAIYAKKLYYEGLYHFESVLAMAIHFNTCIGSPYSHRQVQKKAIATMHLNQEGWKRKLESEALIQAHKDGGKTRGKQMSEESLERMMQVSQLLPMHEKKKGSYDVKAIAEITGYSKSTVYSIIKKLKDDGVLQ